MNQRTFAAIADSPIFQRFIIFVILLAGALVGLETYHEIHTQYLQTFKLADHIIQGILPSKLLLESWLLGRNHLTFSNQHLITWTLLLPPSFTSLLVGHMHQSSDS